MKSRIVVFIFLTAVMLSIVSACGKSNNDALIPQSDNSTKRESTSTNDAKLNKEVITLNFDDIDYISKSYEQYNGLQVKIRGYMSSLSPLDGRFIYLMNIPYQNCPFCLPNTVAIANTVAVYAPDGRSIDFYDGPVEITGTVEVGETLDEFGYFYPFKIIDASYTKLNTSQLSENAKMYGALAQDGIINDIMGITAQIHINAFFETYDDTTFDDVLVIDGAEFENIIKRIIAISKTDYADLISIVEAFKVYNDIINSNLEAKDFSANTTNGMSEEYYYLLDTLYQWLNKFEI